MPSPITHIEGDVTTEGRWHYQGSGKKPYEVMLKASVWSCSCAAWRNQSKPIGERQCKHTLAINGLTAAPTQKPATAPGVMLAEKFTDQDVSGWWASEKLDGVRAWWTGKRFVSRNGNELFAPDWFVKGLPDFPLDGELWSGRGQFQKAVSIVRQRNADDAWENVFYMVFDKPTRTGPFESRFVGLVHLTKAGIQAEPMRMADKAWLLPQFRMNDLGQVDAYMKDVRAKGGEGVMLRKPGSPYVNGRTDYLLKVKEFDDMDVTVTGWEPGEGRHKGRMGALNVVDDNGTVFKVGGGFSDGQRQNADSWIGKRIEIKYQGLTDGGVPRFPVFLRLKDKV